MSLALQILQIAIANSATISTAESCTGGMVAAALTDAPGSSAMFDRGFVTYTNQAKIDMLNVSPETLQAHGAVSEETAFEMALGARLYAGTDFAVSITGIAGPGGSDFKPEGRVCFGLSDMNATTAQTIEFGALGRLAVRQAARDHALKMLLNALRSQHQKIS